MKIIYKLFVDYAYQENKRFEYLFDNYEAIEDGLENSKDREILGFDIQTLAKCESCNEYSTIMFCYFIKKDYGVDIYCGFCADNYKIGRKKYIVNKEKENERDIKTRSSKTKKRNGK